VEPDVQELSPFPSCHDRLDCGYDYGLFDEAMEAKADSSKIASLR
jgi:hypothetical protein